MYTIYPVIAGQVKHVRTTVEQPYPSYGTVMFTRRVGRVAAASVWGEGGGGQENHRRPITKAEATVLLMFTRRMGTCVAPTRTGVDE